VCTVAAGSDDQRFAHRLNSGCSGEIAVLQNNENRNRNVEDERVSGCFVFFRAWDQRLDVADLACARRLDSEQSLDTGRDRDERLRARLAASAATARPLRARHIQQRSDAVAVPLGETMFLAGLIKCSLQPRITWGCHGREEP